MIPELRAGNHALRLSQVAERLLWLDGKPFSLADYPMYYAIYDGRFKSTVMLCGRQVAKSTSLSNFIISESVAIPHFRSYYVSPSKEQTLIFSNSRLGKVLSYSPLIKKHFQSPETADRVLHRTYTNGSENGFTYASDNADRARGFSADRVLYDEFQGILYDEVVTVINQCMANSKYRYETYAGTPKTMETSIQYLWERSSQSEWVMKCEGCSKHNYVVSDKSLGKHGPICLHCGKVLNPRTGFWVDMHKIPEGDKPIKGFHIPQLIMPANIPNCVPADTASQEEAQDRWNRILADHQSYSPSKFRNEVLGVSDALGTRLISLEELNALCTGPELTHYPAANAAGVACTVAGIDWSGGGTEGRSRTVLWIWGWVPSTQKLRCMYYRVYEGNNAALDVDHIAQTCSAFNVQMVVGDAGEGALANSLLKNKLGMHRVTMVQYGSLPRIVQWNGIDRYQADRTTLIDGFMLMLKRQAIEYGPLPAMRQAIADVLNEYEEVTHNGKKIWCHSPSLPDDCLHAQIFGWFAYKLVMMDLQFIT